MSKPKPILVHLALILVSLIYGVNYIFLKTITPDPITPKALLLVRSTGAFIFISILYELKGEKQKIIKKQHWFSLVLCGVCGASINQLLFFEGISRTSAFNSSLIVISIPVFVFILAFFSKKEKFSLSKFLGIILGMAGAALIVINSAKNGNQNDDFLGDIFVLLNCLFFAIYFMLVKPLSQHYQPLLVAKWMFFFGSIISFPFGIQSFIDTSWSTMSIYDYLVLSSLIIIVTSAGYIVNTWALKYANATNVSFYIYLQPLFTGVGTALFMNETFSLAKLLSAILIFVGVYLINRK